MPILTAEERVGTLLADKIRLDRILGQGGMGVVYAGVHLGLDLPVAVKFLHGELARHPDVASRFLTEARATGKLRHPNVIDVRDVGTTSDGSAYMVLELLRGESLATRLETRGALTFAEAVSILVPTMDGLAAAHAAGIIHRDIKPDNVFLSVSADGRLVPKLLDFGIAKLADGASSGSATATGAVMGTPYYMAPEQALGRKREIGPWSDVWSMAVMTYECLAGRLPFTLDEETSMAAILLALMTAEIAPLSRYRTDAPPELDHALLRAMARVPSHRTQSIAELRGELVGAIGELGHGAPTPAHGLKGIRTGPLGFDVTVAPVAAETPVPPVGVSTGAPTIGPVPARPRDAQTAPAKRPLDSAPSPALSSTASTGTPNTGVAIATDPGTRAAMPRRTMLALAAVVIVIVLGVGIGLTVSATGESTETVTGTVAPDPTRPEVVPTTVDPARVEQGTGVGAVDATETPRGEPSTTEPPHVVARETGDERVEAAHAETVRESGHRPPRDRTPPTTTATTMSTETTAPEEPTTTMSSDTAASETSMREHRGGSVSLEDF